MAVVYNMGRKVSILLGFYRKVMDAVLIQAPEQGTNIPISGYVMEYVMHGQCNARPMMIFLAKEHCHCPLAGTYFPSQW